MQLIKLSKTSFTTMTNVPSLKSKIKSVYRPFDNFFTFNELCAGFHEQLHSFINQIGNRQKWPGSNKQNWGNEGNLT